MLIYGKGVKTLSKDIDRSKEDTQEIIDKLWSTFVNGAKWLDKMANQVKKYGYVVSNIGRRRNLYRVLTGHPAIIASAERRAKNSPIQGMSSELGTLAAYLTLKKINLYPEDWRKGTHNLCRLVHDAAYYETSYSMVLPAIHVMQYCATAGVTAYCSQHFGFDMLAEPEIEVEVSAREDVSYKWDWQIKSLLEALWSSLGDQVELGLLQEASKNKAMRVVLKPWLEPAHLDYLQTNYPLLGVADLNEHIMATAKAFVQEKGL